MSPTNLANTPRNSIGEEARRSTRIERSVPLIVFGQNRMGEPFVERTVSTSVNLHGCRYPSRHDYGVGSWITLQVVGMNVEPRPASVRARVRSVHPSQSARELQQVGVELESPENVWGIAVPPQDWLPPGQSSSTSSQFATAVAPAMEPTPISADLEEPPVKHEPKMAEVATFPSPSPVAAKPPAPKEVETPKPQRVVITPDGLVAALQGRLQQAAEKAAQAAAAKHVQEALRGALGTLEDVRQSSVREVQELFPTVMAASKISSKEEFASEIAAQWKEQMESYRAQAEELAQRLEKQAADLRHELEKSRQFMEKMTREIEPQIHARVDEAVTQAATVFEGSAARTIDRRYERLLENMHSVTQEALMKLDARSAESQALVQGALNTALAEFQRQAETHADSTLAEAKERAAAALASLDAESRAKCDVRRRELEAEVARSTERSTDQFRKGMKAFLYSCLVAAVSAVDEHSKSTLDGLLKDNGKTLYEASSDSSAADDEVIPKSDLDPLTH